MDLKNITNAVTSKVGRQGLKLQKGSPTIMFGAGVVGVVATVFIAARATLKIEEILEEHEENNESFQKLAAAGNPKYTEDDANRDHMVNMAKTAIKITKLYAPAVLVGAASIGLLTGSHVTLQRRNAGLIAAYTAVSQGFEEYRDRVRKDVGDEKDLEYRYGTAEKEILTQTKKGEDKVEVVKVYGDGDPGMYARVFDEENENWNPMPEKNLWFFKMNQTYFNQKLQQQGHVFLNEIYDALGFPRTPYGQLVGWVKEHVPGKSDGYIDFGIWDDENMETLQSFMSGREGRILLDFNVDGAVYDLI